MLIISWIILSLVVGALGDSRTVGFWVSFLISLFLSPLVGLIVVLASERKSDIHHKRKMEELAQRQYKAQTGTLSTEDKAKLYDEMTKNNK